MENSVGQKNQQPSIIRVFNSVPVEDPFGLESLVASKYPKGEGENDTQVMIPFEKKKDN